MSTYLNQVYDNKVIEDTFEEQLLTKLNLNDYLTVDTSLVENEGQILRIKKYSGVGGVEHLSEGEGNSSTMSVRYSYVDHKVGRTQGEWDYSDGEYYSDNMAIEEGIKYMQTAMTNDYTQRAVEQYLTTANVLSGCTWTYDNFVDAANLLNREGLTDFFILISPTIEAAVKKQLKDQLKYRIEFVKDSYIGHINNLPVIVSKAIPENTAIIANKQAVKAIIKAGTQVERKREPNEAMTKLWIRKWDVVALVREDLCCMMIGNGGEKPEVTPETSNTGATCTIEADGTIRVVGESVTAGVPSEWASEFPETLTNGIVLNLQGLIPSAGATIVQTNIALSAYASDPNVKKVGRTYQKTKAYDGTDPDYQLIIQEGKMATVKVGDFVYRVKGDFVLKHYEN